MTSQWRRTTISGKAADVIVPKAEAPRFVLCVLPDDAAPQGLPESLDRLLVEANVACVVPRVGSHWWVDRVCPSFDAAQTPERFVCESVVAFVRDLGKLGPRTTGLLGEGTGGQGALRMAFRHSSVFPIVAALAPAIEYHELYHRGTMIDDLYDSKEQCRQDTAIMHINPTAFPAHIYFASNPDGAWHRGADRLHEKLNALGVPHVAEFEGPAVADRAAGWEHAFRFVLAGLERESRRLV
jgi:S-formylglutathione hydrolase